MSFIFLLGLLVLVDYGLSQHAVLVRKFIIHIYMQTYFSHA